MIGQTISHYRIVAKLGEGGMGVVYKAEDTKLRRVVALKFLAAHLAGDDEVRRRFLHEAQAVAALTHPNICVVYEVDDEHDFLAMEYVEGETVAAKVKRRPLPLREALNIALQAAQGLQAAHQKRMVHRDVKSANLMLTPHGQVKVMDFGLAQVGGQTRITHTGYRLGTPAYMSPEQFRGETIDQRSDIWSLGVVLYEMIAGKMPFPADTEPALLYAVLHSEPEPLTALRTDVPVELDRLARKALSKDRLDRYQHADDLVVDLKALLKGKEAVSTAAIKPRGRRALAVAALLLAMAAGVVWNWRQRVDTARVGVLQEATRLFDAGQTMAAYKLASQLEAEIPNDPRLLRLWDTVSFVLSVRTEPPGADVHIRDLSKPESDWIPIGKSPLVSVRAPIETNLRWRFTLDGYDTLERTGYPQLVPPLLELVKRGSTPPGMVYVPGGTVSRLGLRATVEDFWLDQYEVTNSQFKKFIEAAGYRETRFWKHPFVENGRPLSFEQAMTRFTDSTGRPGPAGWELGSYPAERAESPVGGVSWYEAAAYAEFAGKQLPTVFHWWRAAVDPFASEILPVSNFDGKEAAAVGKYQGVSPFGNYDLAGNVKEWCWNQTGDRRNALGGAWNEPSYTFLMLDARSPFERSETTGFRCARYSSTPSNEALAPIRQVQRDYSKEKPVSDEMFRAYRSLYSYDRGPLDTKVEQVDEDDPSWRKEKITFNAAYGNERMLLYLYLPRNATPPYQAVIHFPGSYARFWPTPENLSLFYVRFFVQSGRALVFPIYQGFYERRPKIRNMGQHAIRDEKIQWSKDLGRSIDYLETRQDIDLARLAYHGFSLGASAALPLLTMEERLKTAVLLAGGLPTYSTLLPEEDPINFVPRVQIPALMINGRDDFLNPVEGSQLPLFRFLGSPAADKRHVIVDGGHVVPRNIMIKESLDWLDRYLGPVQGRP